MIPALFFTHYENSRSALFLKRKTDDSEVKTQTNNFANNK